MFRIVFRRRRVRRRRREVTVARRKHYALNKEAARVVIVQRVAELNQHYNLTYNRISIRTGRSRWGSCSKKGNLNFNYMVAALPPALRDYVLVHELCHLAVFNHSPAFWGRVAELVPNHRALRKQLQSYGRMLE